MKFVLLDAIDELEPGRRIVARKALSLAEEYLADHFPSFPVLPGVLMLEGLVQASAWVVRTALDFAPSLVVLKAARNVTYRSFVAPGQVLTLESTCLELCEQESRFDARGRIGEQEVVRARLTLAHRTLAEISPELSETDERIRTHLRELLRLLRGDVRSEVSTTT